MDSLSVSDIIFFTGGILVLAGIASSLIAQRFGAPMLVVFLLIGVALGPEGLQLFSALSPQAVFSIGSLALAIILFDGGLRTKVRHLRGNLTPPILLATVGVVITSSITAVAAIYLFDLNWQEGLLVGAIVSSTDAAAVFFLIRAGGLQLPQRVSGTLEVESGSNDPIAVFLTIMLCTWLMSGSSGSVGELLSHLAWEMGLGFAVGVAGGIAIAHALNRLALPEGLHPILALAGAITLFSLCNLANGSGFLAIYVAGLVVGNRPVRAIANITSVQDAATWLAQGIMFIVLGLSVIPSKLIAVLWPALAIAGVLMLIARPVSVWLCLLPFKFRRSEISFISWVGLRGAVGIYLASIPVLLGFEKADLFMNIAFVVVIVSLLVQGWTLAPSARMFGVALPRKELSTRRIELDLPGQLALEMVGYRVAKSSAILGKNPALPGWARKAMIVRDERVMLPDEAGPLQAGDTAYFLAPPGDVYRLDWLFAEGAEAHEAEQEMFGAFTLPGDVPLGELGDYYGLPIPKKYAQYSAAQLFSRRFDNAPQIGDQLNLGAAVLVVRQIFNERVQFIGIKFQNMGSHVFGSDAVSLSGPSAFRRFVASVTKRRSS